MKDRCGKLFISIVFLTIIFVIGIGSMLACNEDLRILTRQFFSGEQPFSLSALDGLIKDNLFHKENLVELNGLSDSLMRRNLVGNGSFFRDSDGIMHIRRGDVPYDELVSDTRELAKVLKQRGTPLLVCQTPERANYGDEFSRLIDGLSVEYINNLKEAVIREGAFYLDESVALSNAGFSAADIFFRTDIHCTTQAEFEIVRHIVQILEGEGGLVFSNKLTTLDLNRYQTESVSTSGNLIGSSGKYYVEDDEFIYYIPLFDTSMHMENPVGTPTRDGEFEKVCMNGVREQCNPEDRVYRMTDYMQWPSPYYRVTNDFVSNNDILVVGCSMSMRKMAYLSLLCRSVTVLDPRYFGETDYLGEALTRDYDAVIVFPSANLLSYGLGKIDNRS